MQELPFGGRRRGVRPLHELLHPPAGVGEGPPLFGMGAAGQQVIAPAGWFHWQNIADDERFQPGQQARPQPQPVTSSPTTSKVLMVPARMPSAIRQVAPIGVAAMPVSGRPRYSGCVASATAGRPSPCAAPNPSAPRASPASPASKVLRWSAGRGEIATEPAAAWRSFPEISCKIVPAGRGSLAGGLQAAISVRRSAARSTRSSAGRNRTSSRY